MQGKPFYWPALIGQLGLVQKENCLFESLTSLMLSDMAFL